MGTFTWDISELTKTPELDDWSKYGKRRFTVERGDHFEDVIGWNDREDLEGDTVIVDGVECEIDGFGSSFCKGGLRQCYCYIAVPDGESLAEGGDRDEDEDDREYTKHEIAHGIGSKPEPRGANTTGPGGCPHCGGPTSISGQPCGGCV